MVFIKGQKAWNKGKTDSPPRPQSVKDKISNSTKGKSKPWLKGRKLTEETKLKIRTAALGLKRPWVKGHPKGWKHTDETRKKLSGPACNFWKGGITPVHLALRMTHEYKLWRTAVFERDRYTCIWCGVKGGTLNADHIKPFAHYPELRFAIDNGRTLCVNCHRTTDTWGRKTR